MRILFISNFYPPYDLGGWEQNCQEIVQQLRARGHECFVLTSRHGMADELPSEEGVTRALYLQADVYHYQPLDFFLHRPSHELANRQALRTALYAFQPDVVFIWGMWNLSPQVAYWAEQWLPRRVVYAVAGYWFMRPNVHEAYWHTATGRRWWARALMAPARRIALDRLAREETAYPLALEQVACVSEYVRRKLSEAGVLLHGARVIYNGIDPRPFIDAAAARVLCCDEVRLVCVGGLAAHKGVHTAIEALGLLQQQRQAEGLSLTILGGGHPDYEARLKRRVEELDLHERVAFRGRVPRDQIAGILADHDVLLFTSVYEEPIARTVMEAMAAGLAVIGTAVGGQREMLLEGINALIFPPDNAHALAECVHRLSQDLPLRTQLAAAGHTMVLQRFTLERMVDEMEAWLEEISESAQVADAASIRH